MWVKRCLIWNAILGRHFNVKLELGNEALLIPQPNNQAIIWLTSLKNKVFISYMKQNSVQQLTRVKRKFVSFSSE